MTGLVARKSFGSDNHAGTHPEVMRAIVEANTGDVVAYGADPWTERATGELKRLTGAEGEVYLVLNGSGANVLGLGLLLGRHEAVICAETAHINTDECGSAERILGTKLLTVPSADGKLTPQLAKQRIDRIGDEHVVQPRVLTVSQSTELGTVYQPAELQALAAFAHEHDLVLHVDGSRLTNAAAALGVSLGEASTAAGADVVSFGGTKNGLLGGEAVVFADPALADGFLYLRKLTLQLASKMRFVAAQFDAYLTDELWRRNAAHANAMATRLRDALVGIDRVRITRPVQANVVFASLPAEAIEPLQREFPFYTWDERAAEVRWMCAWDTTESDVDAFAGVIRRQLGASSA